MCLKENKTTGKGKVNISHKLTSIRLNEEFSGLEMIIKA